MTEQRLTQVTIVDKDILDLQPGEMTCDSSRKSWLIGCPICKGPGGLVKHTVIEQDGTVTVSPSILCGCGAHYFVRQNKIEWC